MGGKSKAPPPPDYGPIAQASKEAAEVSAAVAREQLAWAREQYASDKAVSDQVVEAALKRQDEQDALARKDRERYETQFQPLEDSLIADAKSYNSEARREQEAGAAQADVSMQFEAARHNAMEELESYGVDPTQTRSGALDVSLRTQEAAARAGAGNTARKQVEATGMALRDSAINVGRGYPGQTAASLNAATQSGNQAVNSGNATTATGAQTMGTGTQWEGQSVGALNTWGNTLNMGYNNAIARAKTNNDASSGIGSALGLIGGIAAKSFFASDERVKEDIQKVGQTDDGQNIYRFRYKGEDAYQLGLIAQEVERTHPEAVAEDPNGVKMVDYSRAIDVDGTGDRAVPMQGTDTPSGSHYAEGGAVPAYDSPSGGRDADDVKARLSAGEFVVPKDVMSWLGEEKLQKLVAQAREAKSGAGAKPTYRALEV